MSLIKFVKKNVYKYICSRQCPTVKKCTVVNNSTKLSKNTKIGLNVNFNGMRVNGKGVVIFGDNFHSGTDCLIITQFHNYDHGVKIPYDNTYIIKNVIIEDNVWIGDRVLILGGVVIGEGAIIQAGSVVVSDIPAYSIAGGHPARVFKTRDVAHYLALKELKSFH